MFGKCNIFKKILSLSLMLSLVSILSGCGNQSTLHQPVPQELNDPKSYFEIVNSEKKSIFDYKTVSSDVYLNQAISYEWVGEPKFTPLYLSDDGIVYGEARSKENTLSLAAYDCNNGTFKLLKEALFQSPYASIKILVSFDHQLIFEEYDQFSGDAVYYIYDLNTGAYDKLKENEKVVPHYNLMGTSDEGIMISWYDDKSLVYVIDYYSFATKQLERIEEKNSGYPVYYQGYWYYLCVDNTDYTTQLIQYDMKNKMKQVIFETKGLEQYIFGLYSDDNHLLLVMECDSIEKVYQVDVEHKKIHYLFEDEWIECMTIKNGIVSWAGTMTLENRSRPQYYLFDIDSGIHYLYSDGTILLSNTGIAWLDLKKPDQEIDKGKLLENENSKLSYQGFMK